MIPAILTIVWCDIATCTKLHEYSTEVPNMMACIMAQAQIAQNPAQVGWRVKEWRCGE